MRSVWTAQRARALGWLLAAPSLLLAVAALALDAADGWPQVAAGPPTVVGAVNGTVLALVGALIIDHQPRNGTGWIISATGLLLAGMGFCDGLAVALDPAGVGDPAATWVWAANTLGMIAFAGGPPLLLLFPDGRPLSGWRPVFLATATAAAVMLVAQAVGAWTVRGPVLSGYHLSYIDSLSAAPSGFAFAVWGERVLQLGWLVGLAALVARYRRARGAVRQQLSWALLGLGGSALILTVGYVVIGPGVQLVAMIPLTAGVLIAMRRHRLFDADRVVRRAIVYLTLTVLLAGGFAAIALGIGTVAGAGFDAGASVAVAAATLAAAVAANPLRRGLQRQLDRRFDHHTWQAITAVEAFTRNLRDGSATPRNLTGVLQAALQDPSVQIAYYLPDGNLIDDDGHPAQLPNHPDRIAQVVSIGARRIALVDIPRALADSEPRLVEAALSTAALPLENAALHARAAVQLAEVQNSRRRIVDAGDAERRRIERDLHDGAQQRLVASIVRLRRLERRLTGHNPQAAAELDTTVDELRTSLDELRNLARGILPPVLADEGLAVALRSVAARLPVPVTLDVTGVRLPPTVEATVWFVVSEGLANAVKHAHAGQISASVHRHDGHVRVDVTDDGAGGATLTPGGGLQGLADRVAAIGGRFEVRSPLAAGTTLVAELRCES